MRFELLEVQHVSALYYGYGRLSSHSNNSVNDTDDIQRADRAHAFVLRPLLDYCARIPEGLIWANN